MNYLPELRKSLVRAAERQRQDTRRPRARALRALPVLVGVLVAVAVAAVGLILAGHHRAAPAAHPLPPTPTEPHLSGSEQRYINAAWLATVKRDKACNGFHGSELTNGSPSPELTRRFGVLQTPATSADKLVALLRQTQSPGSAGGQQLYINQIRRARSAFGADFYVLPAGNVSGQAGVPARCGPEQVAALKTRLAQAPAAHPQMILAAQSRYLAYLRYQALHPEGICATYLRRTNPLISGGDTLGCATLAEFARYGVMADASSYLGGHVAAFWTVVPDGVAAVAVLFTPPTVGHPVTITVRPINNVVVAREPFDAPYHSGFPSRIVLRSATGRVIRSIQVTPNMPTLCGYGC